MNLKKNERNSFLKILCVFAIFILLFAFIENPLYAEAQSEIKTIKVGYMLIPNFEEKKVIVQGDREITVRSGYGYEYLQMLRNYTGWEYEYVEGTWEGLVEKLRAGEIDVLSHVAKTTWRENEFLFSTEPQGMETHYLFVDGPNKAISETDYSTLNGKKIGVISGDFRTDLFLEWCQDHSISCDIVYYENMEKIHDAIHSGEIHAVSASSLSAASCPDGKWRSIVRFDDSPVYFAVKKGAEGEQILAKINDAQRQILSINQNYGIELQQKYNTDFLTEAPVLTEGEKEWLKNKGNINVGYCNNRRPLAYTDEKGKLSGLLADYLVAMSAEYGIKFTSRSYPTGTALLNGLLNGEVDVISPVGYNYGMAEAYGLALTNPLTIEVMLAVYKGYKGTEPKDIFKKIAILDNSITEKDYAQRHYSDSEWARAQTIEEAIDLVANDEAGCYIIRSSTWSWYKNDYPVLNDLQVLTLPDSNEVNMAVRNEDIPLVSILNKGISLLSDADVNQSLVAYSDARAEITFFSLVKDNPVTTIIVFITIILALGLVYLFIRLNTEKKYLKKLESANKKEEEARLEAERANMAKSTFLTSMSHDIRTPMNAIIGMTTLASKHLSSPDYVRNCLSKVTLASDHLLTLINDVLDINKIESGNLSLTPTVFSLADSIMNLANIGRHHLQEKNHRFEIRIHNIKQEYLFADELRINQVFINLLSNAVKYTPVNGCITIDVKQELIPKQNDKIRLIYMIEDTGIGMSEDFQKHMYELFVMANKSARTITGSGVGLSICKQLVDLMDGTIECQSTEGIGTKFTVTLDLPVADKVVDELMLPPMKLLLVDDDEIFLSTATETLKELGLSPDMVDSGEKAVEMVIEKHKAEKDYPLIIIDWKMPEMDGIETTRRIREIVGEEVSIIVISAYAPEDIREAAMSAGANGFISKPFFKSTAYHSIRDILGLSNEVNADVSAHHAKVKGMNVLVAEDNDLNWEIARELLAMYEITSTRAENGMVCVEMLEGAKPNEYDVVLMDIQMPVMDGYEATKAIRRSDNNYVCSIPIVAMTADAYTEDVLLCAEAGMNSHVPKPIDMERLLEVLGDLRSKKQ